MTEAQYLLMCHLVYIDDFTLSLNEGKTVEVIVNEIIDSGVSLNGQEMEPEEWNDILELVKNDPEIKNLTVTSVYKNGETDGKMACLVDSSGQAYAAYAGTGKGEWGDNALGAINTDTDAQNEALEWIDGLGYNNIIVTGHSKGGNKAMYTAIVSDNVSECYSFDGQGFSQEFIDKYQDKINALNSDNKIHSISHYRDFVNILLNGIAGDTRYVYNENGITGFAEYHSPNSMFKYEYVYENGEWTWKLIPDLADVTEQSAFSSTLNGLILYILENFEGTYSNKEGFETNTKEEFVNWVADVLNSIFASDEEMGLMDQISLGANILSFDLIKYIREYFTKLKTEDPEKYNLFLEELFEIMVDLLGLTNASIIIKLLENPENIGLNLNTLLPAIGAYKYNTNSENYIRDFTTSAKEQLLETVKEVEEEPWWDVTKWDCWYRADQLVGKLDLERYTGDMNDYHRKIIDINDTSAQDIEKMFDAVYDVEATYQNKLQVYSSELDELISTVSNEVSRLMPSYSSE